MGYQYDHSLQTTLCHHLIIHFQVMCTSHLLQMQDNLSMHHLMGLTYLNSHHRKFQQQPDNWTQTYSYYHRWFFLSTPAIDAWSSDGLWIQIKIPSIASTQDLNPTSPKDANPSVIDFCSHLFDECFISNCFHLFCASTKRKTKFISIWCNTWYFAIKPYSDASQK